MEKVIRMWVLCVLVAWVSGCGKETATDAPEGQTADSGQQSSPAQVEVRSEAATSSPMQAAAEPAERSSFNQVAKHLDPGGNFYLYISMEQAMSNATTAMREFQETMLRSLENAADPQAAQQINAYGDLLIAAMEQSGAPAISGIGMSAFATAPGHYRNKAILHRYPSDSDGRLWQMLGNQPHDLDSLKLMPADTVLAQYGDLDLGMLWTWLNELSQNHNAPELQQRLAMIEQVLTSQQLPPDQLFDSLGGGMGIAITLSSTSTSTLPVSPDQPLAVPSPGAMIFLKTQNDLLYDHLIQTLQGMGMPLIVEQVGDFRLSSMQMGNAMPIPLMPTLAAGPGYLMIASHADIVKSALAAYQNGDGLLENEHFTTVSQGIPATGNQWHYISPRLQSIVGDLKHSFLQANSSQDPQELAELEKLLDGVEKQMPWSYGVMQVTEEGLVMTANTNASIANIMLIQTAITSIGAGMALPMLSKSRVKARRVNSAGNLKQLSLALLMYSGDHDGDFPKEDGAAGFQELVEKNYIRAGKVFIDPRDEQRQEPSGSVTADTTSYIYIGGGLRDDHSNATSMPTMIEKPGSDNWVNIAFIDGHVEGFELTYNSLSEAVEAWIERGYLSEEDKTFLREKAARMDANRHQYGY